MTLFKNDLFSLDRVTFRNDLIAVMIAGTVHVLDCRVKTKLVLLTMVFHEVRIQQIPIRYAVNGLQFVRNTEGLDLLVSSVKTDYIRATNLTNSL